MGKRTFQVDPDVKVGVESGISEGGIRIVTFTEPFKNVPTVLLTVNDSVSRHCYIQAGFVSVTGFVIAIVKTQSGAAAPRTVGWMAVDYELD